MNKETAKKYTQKMQLPILVFIIGTIISYGISYYIKTKNKIEAGISFQIESQKIVSIIKRNIETNQYGLRGARGIFILKPNASLKDYKLYAKSRNLEKEFPGALGFGFIQRINENEIKSFESEMKKNRIDDFKIHNLNNLETEKSIKDKKYIIKYIEPMPNNYDLIGLNIASGPNRLLAAEAAMYSGEARMSSPIEINFKNENQIGSYFFLPVYKNNLPIFTPEEREKALIGWTFAPIVYEKDIDTILKDYHEKIDIEIFTKDGELIYDADQLYANLLKLKNPKGDYEENEAAYNEREFEYSSTINVGGFEWRYHTSSLKKFKSFLPQISPTLVYSTGMLINLIISGLLASISLVRFRALEIAEEMTIKYKEKKEEAEKATQDKSDFLATIGHEIRTPLGGIISLSQFLLESELNNDQKMLAGNLKDSSTLLLHLLNDILDYSKIEAHKLKIEHVEFNLEKIFKQVNVLFQAEVIKKGILLNLKYDKKIAETLVGDEFRIRQIITNLISNSIKFTKSGSIELNVESINTDNSIQYIKFSIKDTGIGIPKEAQEKLFDRYSQADDSISRKYGGTGLGLSITKALVELMNGTINLNSEVGIGTEFIITLPLKISHNIVTTNFISKTQIKVLVIEDNEINLMIALKTLQKLDIAPDKAQDGISALNLLDKNIYDLIFLDLELPDTSGIDLAKKIRSIEKNKSIIIGLSAHTADDKKQKCLENGMDDFISKPFSKSKAQEILMKWVNNSN